VQLDKERRKTKKEAGGISHFPVNMLTFVVAVEDTRNCHICPQRFAIIATFLSSFCWLFLGKQVVPSRIFDFFPS
jgi:hypothetical protein